MPDVSVIIPTHNRADFVSSAITSVLEQRLPPAEVIVIDDYSSDDTPEVLDGFGDAIRAVRTEKNVERGAARNLGARLARYDVLAFLDSDDRWEPDKLAVQLANASADVPSVTGFRSIDKKGRLTGRSYSPGPKSEHELLFNNYCLGSGSSVVLPRLAFEEGGGFPEERDYQGSEDWMFLVQLLWAGWPIRTVREPLVEVRVHPGGWTQKPENLERSMWAAAQWLEQQHLGPPCHNNMRRNRVATAIACAYIARGRWAGGRRWGRVALTHGPPAGRLLGAARIARAASRTALRRRPPDPAAA